MPKVTPDRRSSPGTTWPYLTNLSPHHSSTFTPTQTPNYASVTDSARPPGTIWSSGHTNTGLRSGVSISQPPPTRPIEMDSIQRPLYFFYDCETTGSGPLTTDIIELAAIVADPNGKRNTFSRLVRTEQPISSAAYCIHGIKNDDVEDKAPFPEVFETFCKWVTKQTELTGAEGNDYYPVLVAHNGYPFDYRVLLSKIEQHDLDSSWFEKHVKFADSLHHLRQIKKEGDPMLNDLKLSLGSLYMNFFPDEEYEGHRALPDAEHLKKLFTKSPLKSLLASIPATSYDEQLKKYEMAWDKKMMQVTYGIKTYQAKRLAECGLSTDTLEELYKAANTDGEFHRVLREKGVKSKMLRENLLLHFENST